MGRSKQGALSVEAARCANTDDCADSAKSAKGARCVNTEGRRHGVRTAGVVTSAYTEERSGTVPTVGDLGYASTGRFERDAWTAEVPVCVPTRKSRRCVKIVGGAAYAYMDGTRGPADLVEASFCACTEGVSTPARSVRTRPRGEDPPKLFRSL
mmetsp:Transcript_21609/g.42978  ORF Transcript_21609/g.42978 Transcript_21609/m.42978 type:complete len:154 (-) Transcript_21609:492-953(-)